MSNSQRVQLCTLGIAKLSTAQETKTLILTQFIVQLLNQYFAADADFWGSFQFLLTTTSEVAVTFIAISIAIMAVMNTRAENNAELRKFIKFDFMYCSILSVLMPLLLLMFASPYSGASISLLILFEIIAVVALFVCIWRIMNRVYYSGLQIENELLCSAISNIHKNIRGLPAQVDNVEDVLMRVYPKASHISSYTKLKADKFDLCGYDSEFMIYLRELSERIFTNASSQNIPISLDILFEKNTRKMCKWLKPRIQSPLGAYRICANIQAVETAKTADRMCLVLLASYIAYAEKHQNQSLWNRMVGRTDYVCKGDSYLYSLCAQTLEDYSILTNTAINGDDLERLYKKSYLINKDNSIAINKTWPNNHKFKTISNYDFNKFVELMKSKEICAISFTFLLFTCFLDFIPIYLKSNSFSFQDEFVGILYEIMLLSTLISAIFCWINVKADHIKQTKLLLIISLAIAIVISAVTYQLTVIQDWIGLASEILFVFTLSIIFAYSAKIQGLKTPERLMISTSYSNSRKWLQTLIKNKYAWIVATIIAVADGVSILIWTGVC